MKTIALTCILGLSCLVVAQSQTPPKPLLNENQFQEKLRSITIEQQGDAKLSIAKQVPHGIFMTSLQVKSIAAQLGSDDARLDFARTVYPYTIDPTNYYEVYDAFKTFSKVMRLHDFVRDQNRSGYPHPVPGPQPVSDVEMKEIMKTIRQEAFDTTKLKIARQIVSGKQHFMASQIKEILMLFAFEDARLDLAKFCYDYTLDKSNYYILNQVFAFGSNKEALTRYVESRKHAAPPARR